MASHLAHIFGTEQDRVNCSFYLKIGACRHGDRCSRKHIKPQYSQTILLPNVYSNPAHTPQGAHMSPADLQANFDAFYEDFFIELCKYGNLQEMHVCDNIGDHLMGNVYARYDMETESAKALDNLNDRWYAMRPLLCELSPVSDFRESCCRQNEMGECKREGFCNFMHLCHPSPALVKSLQASQRISRRNAAAEAAADGAKNTANLGWVPGGAKAGGGSSGGGSWQPKSAAGGGGGGGDTWEPPRRR